MWLLLFSTLFRIQGMEVDTEDYSSLGEKMIYLTKTYRDSVGDIAAPIYPSWESQTGVGKVYAGRMLNVIWFTWLMNQFFLTIILLNFLIAILAESFNVVMAEEM